MLSNLDYGDAYLFYCDVTFPFYALTNTKLSYCNTTQIGSKDKALIFHFFLKHTYSTYVFGRHLAWITFA